MGKYWNRAQWKQAMDMHGSEDEQEAYRKLAQYLFPMSMKLLTSRYFSTSFLNQNADLSLEKLAEEYVQRALLKIFENYSNFKWQCEITTYAVRILQTEILQSIRRPAVRRELSTTFQEPDEVQPDTDPLAFLISRQSVPESHFPEQQVQRAELLRNLRLALSQLSDLQP